MPANAPFWIMCFLTLTAATAAMRLRNLVHCALCAAGAFAGLAFAYLLLGAPFVAFAQFLVYVGAVAVLLVFGIMLTRGADIKGRGAIASAPAWTGLAAAGLAGALIAGAMLSGFAARPIPTSPAEAPARELGVALMAGHLVCLEILGLLLTAALIGAVVLALREPAPKPTRPAPPAAPPARRNLEPARLP